MTVYIIAMLWRLLVSASICQHLCHKFDDKIFFWSIFHENNAMTAVIVHPFYRKIIRVNLFSRLISISVIFLSCSLFPSLSFSPATWRLKSNDSAPVSNDSYSFIKVLLNP